MRAVAEMRIGLLAIGASTGLAGPCIAATLHVPGEFATINAALDASAFGDTVLVAPGVYTDVEIRDVGLGAPFTSCAFLKDGVVLRSEAGPATTTIDMQNAPGPQPDVVIAFFLDSDDTSVEGFTITGVRPTAGHGVTVSFSGKVTLRDCIFRDMDSGPSTGGGISCDGDLAVIDCEFVNCLADAGGGIIHSGGHLDMKGTTIRNCGNKGAYLLGVSGGGSESALIEDCVFVDNWSDNTAGALHISAYHAGATVRGCYFEGNTSEVVGGALGWGNFGPKVIEDCEFVNNGSSGLAATGGALQVGGGGSCEIRGNTFYGNSTGNEVFPGATVDILTPAVFERNIVAASIGGAGAVGTTSPLEGGCNVYWANEYGNGVPLAKTDQEADPLFCSPAKGDFTVQTNSPCVEPQSGGCGQIGAFPASCGDIAVEAVSFGKIKSLYRQGGGR